MGVQVAGLPLTNISKTADEGECSGANCGARECRGTHMSSPASGVVVPGRARYRSMPGIPIAAVGFACALLAMEGFRLSSVFLVGRADSPFTLVGSALSLVALVVCALVYRRTSVRARMPLPFIVAVGIAYSAFLMMDLGQSVLGGSPPLELLSQLVLDALPILLMFIWAAELYAFGAAAMFYVGGFALLVLALLNALTALLKADAAMMFVAVMPTLSVALLAYFREYTRTRCRYPSAESAPLANSGQPTDEGIPYANQTTGVEYPDHSLVVPPDLRVGGRRFFLVTLMVSMVCFAILFGQVHSLWVDLQDRGTMSLLVQLGTATGTAVAGLLAIAFVRYLWNRRCIEVLKLLLLGTVLVSLWLSSFSDGLWVFSYLAFLNVTQKLVNLLIMLAPFLVVEKSRYLWPWWLTCLSFEAGKCLSQLVNATPGSDLFMLGSVVPLAVLFVCTMATAFMGDARHGEQSRGEEVKRGAEAAIPAEQAEGCGRHGGAPEALASVASGPLVTAGGGSASEEETRRTQANRLRTACTKAAADHGLTARESEILLLLARGRTAATIAEMLVIAPSTAKAHLRNIYAKLEVHTQQELIDLVESYID